MPSKQKDKNNTDQNTQMQGKMDIIMMISEKTRTDKEKNRGKMWLKILRMTKTLTKNRENHHQKQVKICKNARKRGLMKTKNR